MIGIKQFDDLMYMMHTFANHEDLQACPVVNSKSSENNDHNTLINEGYNALD